MLKEERDIELSGRDVSDLRSRILELERQVTACRETEKELRESETRYQLILDNIEDCYFEIDLAGNLTFCNNAMYRISGYLRDELIGMNNREYTTPETSKRMYGIFSKIYLTGKPADITDYEIIIKDGSVKTLELTVSLMRDSGGSPVGCRGLARNVTDIRYAEKIYKTIAEKSFSGMYITCKGKYQYMNSNAASYFGCTQDELIGTDTMHLVHPDDRVLLKKHAAEMLKGKRNTPYEFRLLNKDGDYGWVMESVTPIRYGGESAVLGNCIDITQRKRSENVIKESEQRLSNIINFLPDATMIVDTNGKVIAWNHAMEEMTGVKEDDMLGKGDYEYAVPFYGEKRPTLVDLVSSPDGKTKGVYSYVKKEGETIIVEASDVLLKGEKRTLWGKATPIFNTVGEKTGIIESIRDITEQKTVEKQLRYLSTHDSLTGLYNRDFFEEEMSRFERGRTFPVSVVMLDVDDLKWVNDTRGHDAGDALLKRVAQVLGMVFRADDIAARIGGDEFVVLLPGTGISAAKEILVRFKDSLEDHNREYPDLPLSLSVGVAEGAKGDSLPGVQKKADEIMYEEKLSKKKSKNGNFLSRSAE
ncbi:MAG: PAS domain S-box protein [Deltaproteobacteria bacterium]|nr:PAS domain S-box protein [Deltaproteobacteria bacterium]